jgi:hypothetical protein
MAVSARPYEGDTEILHVSLTDTLVIACRRARHGQGASATDEVSELLDEAWIKPAPDGGWLLT